jgi:hypothetical protein
MREPVRLRFLALTLVVGIVLPSVPTAGEAQTVPAFDPLQSEVLLAPIGTTGAKPLGLGTVAPGKKLVTASFPASKIAKADPDRTVRSATAQRIAESNDDLPGGVLAPDAQLRGE